MQEIEYSIGPEANQSVVQCNTPENFSEVTSKLEQLQIIIPEAGSEYQAPHLKSPPAMSARSPADRLDSDTENNRTPTNANSLFPSISPSIHAPAELSTFNFNNPKKIIHELLSECKIKVTLAYLVGPIDFNILKRNIFGIDMMDL